MAVAELDTPSNRTTPAKHAATDPDMPDTPGRISRWVGRDPVRAVVAVLIVAQLAWRLDTALRGYLAVDDYVLVARAAESKLNADYLFHIFNDHLLPGVLLVTWLVNKAFGLAYWPYALLLAAGQAAVDIAFYRLVRRLLAPGWKLLVPMAVVLFTPLTLETTSMWTTGAMLLPMEVAMVLAVSAQVKYAQTRRPHHLITLAASTILGLFFFDKSLLIVALVFLVTACLLVTGGPMRSIWRAIRGFWPSWLILTVVSVGYLALYHALAGSTLRSPRSASEVFGFARQMVGFTLIPNLLGGPSSWTGIGDAAPLITSEEVPRWLAWAAFLTVVVVTTRLRAVAGRAWVLLAVYVALVVGLLSVTRLGSTFSVLAGYATRYVSDVTVVAALCLGVAVVGLADANLPVHALRRPLQLPAALRDPAAIAIGLVVLVVAVTAIGLRTASSTARFSDTWAVKIGREYLATAQADLAKAPPGTVFIERTVPAAVVHPLFFPYTEQSHFFNQVQPRPTFVTEAESPSIFDDSGHIRPATVDGLSLRPSPDPGCGYQMAHGQTTRLPLDAPVYQWNWTIRIGYLSSGDSDAIIQLGDASHRFRVKYGLNQIFIVLDGAGADLQLQVLDPSVTVCTKDIVVGNAVPQH